MTQNPGHGLRRRVEVCGRSGGRRFRFVVHFNKFLSIFEFVDLSIPFYKIKSHICYIRVDRVNGVFIELS